MDNRFVKIRDVEDEMFKNGVSSFEKSFDLLSIDANDITQNEWISQTRRRINFLRERPDEYYEFITNIIKTSFSDESDKSIINFMNSYFPRVFDDVIRNLCVQGHYDKVIDIVDYTSSFALRRKNEVLDIVWSDLMRRCSSNMKSPEWKYFDLSKRQRDNSSIIAVEDMDEADKNQSIKDFSEGSELLEICLKTLWKRGFETRACCKGAHLSYDFRGEPSVSSIAYIAFAPGSNFVFSLDDFMLTDDDVFISNTLNDIHYFGNDIDGFLAGLTYSVMTGEKDNRKQLRRKLLRQDSQDQTKAFFKSFGYGLEKIGFDEEQCDNLMKLEMGFLNDSNLGTGRAGTYAKEKAMLRKYIEENNRKLLEKQSLDKSEITGIKK